MLELLTVGATDEKAVVESDVLDNGVTVEKAAVEQAIVKSRIAEKVFIV